LIYENSFSISAEFAEEFGKDAQSIALAIDTQVVNQTPRDTGAASGSWLVSVDKIDETETDNLSRAEALSQGAVQIAASQPYQTIYIQNMQPYIVRLNEGWSQQAPSKYIDTIIQRSLDAD